MMTNKYVQPLIRTFAMSALLSFFIATDIGCIFLDAKSIHTNGFEESGFVEWWQQIQLAVTLLVIILNIQKNRILQPALILMAGCIASGLIREFNNFFNDFVSHGAWLSLVAVTLLVTAFLLYQKRENLLAACYHFTRTPSFGITIAGFFIMFIFSRIMGVPPLWHTILEARYTRYAERTAEESTELIGYTIMLFGICYYTLTIAGQKSQMIKREDVSRSVSSSFREKIKQCTMAGEE